VIVLGGAIETHMIVASGHYLRWESELSAFALAECYPRAIIFLSRRGEYLSNAGSLKQRLPDKLV